MTEEASENFPCDDNVPLEQLTSGISDVSIYYAHQYVQGETTERVKANSDYSGCYTTHKLEHKPVILNTMTGEVYANDKKIGAFVICKESAYKSQYLADDPETDPKLNTYHINHDLGKIIMEWDSDPGEVHFVVDYEYNL